MLLCNQDDFVVLYTSTINWIIGLVCTAFASGPGDLVSIPGHVIPKTLKNGSSVLNTQQYKVSIKDEVE